MESFFEFIFGNIFIVLIIIFAIMNFFNRGKKAEQEEQRRRRPQPAPNSRTENAQDRQPRPTMRSQVENEPKSNPTRMERPVEQTIQTTRKTVSKSIEAQRQEQYERLKSQFESPPAHENNVNPKALHSNLANLNTRSEEEQSPHVSMKLEDKLTSKGLIEGVIMAEVLGSPRALNPYQNIVVKRRRKY